MTSEELDIRLDRIAAYTEANTISISKWEAILEAESKKWEAESKKWEAESKKWDERFFQLSRDTLNFSRNIIVTAAVVTVLAPLLKESVTFALELIKEAQ